MKYGHEATLRIITKYLERNEPISFVRFGDGDYASMYEESIGKVIGGSNQNIVSSEMRQQLIDAHNNLTDNYVVGTIFGYAGGLQRRIDVDKLPNLIEHKNIYSFYAIQHNFLDFSEDNKHIVNFFKELKKTNYLFVGQYYDETLDTYYGDCTGHVKTLPTNSTSQVNDIIEQIKEIDTNTYEKIIFSCGQLARIAVNLLHSKIEKPMIDVGSLSDMLICDTDIYQDINKRKHIRNNREQIISLKNKIAEEL